MCGRYVLTNISGLVARFGLLSPAEPDEAPRYNVAPSQPVRTVVVAGEEARELRRMRWGFQPAWRPSRPSGWRPTRWPTSCHRRGMKGRS